MKRVFMMIMTIAMMFSLFMVPARAVQIDIQPRETVTMTYTERLYVGDHSADVTIYYTTRLEGSTASGMYITGVLRGTIRNVSGWTSVTNLEVDIPNITYSDNHQKASVPVRYEGSIGSGYNDYYGIVTIDLT